MPKIIPVLFHCAICHKEQANGIQLYYIDYENNLRDMKYACDDCIEKNRKENGSN